MLACAIFILSAAIDAAKRKGLKMKTTDVRKMFAEEKNATKEFDDYNTAVKSHTITSGEHIAIAMEMRSGHIKINGTEQFSNYDEMVSCMIAGTKLETVEL